MNITIINTNEEYIAACEKLDKFLKIHAAELDHLPDEADKEFRQLSQAIGEYEDKHYPIPQKKPV